MTTLARVVPDRVAVQATSVARHPGARLGMLLLATAVAFHYTLWTLMRGLTVDSPLAYLGLVPFLALIVGVAVARPAVNEPAIHDTYTDWIIGAPLVIGALAANYFLPTVYSTMFWVWRVDLLTLPLFVAGAVALLFGTRMLWRVRWAIVFLALAWPVPLRTLLVAGLDAFTRLTGAIVFRIIAPLAIADPVGADGSRYRIVSPQGAFDVVLVSACSGANSLLGYLVVLPALLVFVQGSKVRKGLWVTLGLGLVWLANMIRLIGIIAVGKYFGRDVAFDVVHPYAGLLLFMGAMLLMIVLAPKFGLTWRLPTTGRKPVRSTFDVTGHNWRWPAAAVAIVAALLLGMNSSLAAVNPVVGSFGQAQLAPFNVYQVRVPGFKGRVSDQFPWATQFFGEGATWKRYQFAPTDVSRGSMPIFADVVTTNDLQTFDDFDIQSCYHFHGYKVSRPVDVDLGNGIGGHYLVWSNPNTDDVQWSTLYWFWPVNDGGKTRYQRIVLMFAQSQRNYVTDQQATAAGDAARPFADNAESSQRLTDMLTTGGDGKIGNRTFLTEFAKATVQASVTTLKREG